MNDTLLIEYYCFGLLSPEDTLLVEARQLTDPPFSAMLQAQKDAYSIIRMHGREQLRRQIREVEHELFSASRYSTFRTKIFSIFSK